MEPWGRCGFSMFCVFGSNRLGRQPRHIKTFLLSYLTLLYFRRGIPSKYFEPKAMSILNVFFFHLNITVWFKNLMFYGSYEKKVKLISFMILPNFFSHIPPCVLCFYTCTSEIFNTNFQFSAFTACLQTSHWPESLISTNAVQVLFRNLFQKLPEPGLDWLRNRSNCPKAGLQLKVPHFSPEPRSASWYIVGI